MTWSRDTFGLIIVTAVRASEEGLGVVRDTVKEAATQGVNQLRDADVQGVTVLRRHAGGRGGGVMWLC